MTPKKYSDRKREERTSARSETLGVILIIASAFFLVCLITRALILGFVGRAIANVLLGLVGLFAYALFLFTLITGILKVKQRSLTIKKRFVIGLVVITLAVILIANLASSAQYLGLGFSEYASAVYGAKNTVGGLLFGLVNYLFYLVFGTVLSYIVFSLAIVVTLFFMTGFFAGLPMNRENGERKNLKASGRNESVYGMHSSFASSNSGGLFVGTIERADGRFSRSGSFDGIREADEPDASETPEDIKDKIYNYERAKKLLFTENTAAFEQFLPKTQVAAPIPSSEKKVPEEAPIPEIAMPTPKEFEHRFVAGEIINGDEIARREAEDRIIDEKLGNVPPVPVASEPSIPTEQLKHEEATPAERSEYKPYFNPAPIINGDFYESGKEITYTMPYSAPVTEAEDGFSEDDISTAEGPLASGEPTDKDVEFDDLTYAPVDEHAVVDDTFSNPAHNVEENEKIEEKTRESEDILTGCDSFVDLEDEQPFGAVEGGDEAFELADTDDRDVSEGGFAAVGGAEGRAFDEDELVKAEDELKSPFNEDDKSEPEIAESVSAVSEEEKRRSAFEDSTTSFEIIDEVEDRSESSFSNPDDTTGYYNPITEPIAPIVRKSSFERNVRSIEENVNTQKQIDIEAYAQKSAEKKAEEQPKPAVKPSKPKKYVAPPIDLLTTESGKPDDNQEDMQNKIMLLENVLEEMGVPAKVHGVTVGPSVTRYELDMPPGISVKKVETLSADIRYNLASKGKIRIETPIPGKRAVGIELPNDVIQIVALKDIIASKEFKASTSPLTIALGKDIQGKVMLTRLDKLPHVLVAGATGSGKSSCLNSLLISLLYKASPQDVRLILIDPKRVEFTAYNGLPHMMIPNAITDVNQAVNAFKWAYDEMERRYITLQQNQVRNIGEYNDLSEVKEGVLPKMPFIIVIVDELANLITASKSTRKTLEDIIMAIASKARAAGIHLVLATQRPSVDVITGTIKANLPSRIAFAVTSIADSRTILDNAGAELLLGRGDMLFAPVDASEETRIQGAYVENLEVKNIVNFVKEHNQCDFNEEFESAITAKEQAASGSSDSTPDDNNPYDEELIDVARCVIKTGQASTSMIQRRFRFGWNKAARIMDQLSELNFIGPAEGAKPREVLATKETFEEFFGEEL